jgi:hypothetical protein
MIGIVFTYLRWISRSKRTAADPEALAGWCLMNKKSFRTGAASSPLLYIVRRCFAVCFATRKHSHVLHFPEGTKHIAMWDNRDVSAIRNGHVLLNHGDAPSLFIPRDAMAPEGGIRFPLAAIYVLLLPFLCMWSFFCRQPLNIALLYDEWNEAIGLMQCIKKYKVRFIYFYCPFENDANALYLLLRKCNVTVNKVPSPNLLAIANQEILTDILTLSSPCQTDELPLFRSTQKYDAIQRWLPEQFAAYADVYKSSRTKPQANTIGFYSHGSWMRKEQGIKGIDLGDIEAELQIVDVFGRILKKHPHLKCTVFLHPKEKKPEFLERTRKYYDAVFGKDNYVFGDPAVPGSKMFDTVDVGVGAISTILFERLFLGCKTIFYPVGIKIFPVEGSAIEHICPVTESALETLILQSSAQSNEAFFSAHDLVKYTIYNWKPELHYAKQS